MYDADRNLTVVTVPRPDPRVLRKRRNLHKLHLDSALQAVWTFHLVPLVLLLKAVLDKAGLQCISILVGGTFFFYLTSYLIFKAKYLPLWCNWLLLPASLLSVGYSFALWNYNPLYGIVVPLGMLAYVYQAINNIQLLQDLKKLEE